jgi:transcriptional regulator with XRE-family HTH domain
MTKKREEPTMVEQLRQAIRDSGLSLKTLGDRSEVSHSQLSRFMHGLRTLTFPAAARVCEELGLELRPVKKPPAPPPAARPAGGKKPRKQKEE